MYWLNRLHTFFAAHQYNSIEDGNMVGIVSGNSLGLSNSSLATLGQRASQGNAPQGRSGEQIFVNIATGNLVIASNDDQLVAHGGGFQAVRTYNSQGVLNDDNADNWGSGFYRRQLVITGQAGQADSSITRLERDGGSALFTWDAASGTYLSTDGGGAYNRIELAGSGYILTDGATQNREYYGADTGRLDKSVDASGNTTSYSYDANDNIVKLVNPSGESIHYDYTDNRLTRIRVVDSTGVTTTRTNYTYDARNRLASVTVDLSPQDGATTDGNIYKTTYTYHGDSNRVASIVQSDGTKLNIDYVQVGADFKVSALRDALGQTTLFSYDSVARTTQVTDPVGKKYAYAYDASGQLLSITSPTTNGAPAVQRFEYAANGDLIRTTDPDGRSVFMAYDARGNQVLQRDGAGNTITRTYSSQNRLLTETVYTQPDPDGDGAGQASGAQTTRYVYDDATGLQLRFAITSEGRVTEYRRNAYGEVVSTLQHQAARYSAAAQAVEAALVGWTAQQDLRQLQRTDYVLDFRGQVQTTTTYAATDAAGNGLAAGSTNVRHIYDQSGRLLQIIDGNGGATTYTYDGLGRLLAVTDAKGQITSTVYGDAGGRVTITSANGLQEVRSFDSTGRLVSSQRSDATSSGTTSSTTFVYDAAGRLRMTEDATQVRSWIVYDDAGRKAGEISHSGQLREFFYNNSGQLTRTIQYATTINTGLLTAGNGATIAAIRPVATSLDRSEWVTYDAAGRLWKTVASDGSVTESAYDGASRLVSTRRYATAIATNSLGNSPAGSSIAPAVNAAMDRVTRYFHDADGLHVGTLDAEGYLIVNAYDATGRLVSTSRLATQVDAAKRTSATLQEMLPTASGQDIVERRLYDGKGQLTATVDGAGYLTVFEYNANGNLIKQIRYATALTPITLATISSTTPIVSIRPATSAQDRISLSEYDALGRLTAQTDHQGSRTEHAYDTAGNLISSTVAAGSTEARTQLGRYDAQGRLIAELTGEGAKQLAAAKTPAQIETVWSSYARKYTYDQAGRRTSATDANGLRTLFFYNTSSQLTHTINALGEVSETRYDALGQVSAQVRYGTRINPGTLTGPLAGGLVNATLQSLLQTAANAVQDQATQYSYNTSGTLTKVRDALGFTRNYVYNTFREEIQRTDATGNGTSTALTTTSYNRRGQVTGQIRDAEKLAASTGYTYDAFGNQLSVRDAMGNTRTKAYDKLGREVVSTDALRATLTTTYDAFSRIVSQVNAEGNTTSYAYDATARSVTITTGEGLLVKQIYNRHGDMVSVTDAVGNTTSYSYDSNGQQTGVSTKVWQFDTKTTQTVATAGSYDRAGRLIEAVDANGTRTTITYDSANRVLTKTSDTGGLGLTTQYAYDPLGRQIQITAPGGTVTQLRYDAKGQLLEQLVDPTGLALSTRYAYDAQGNTLEVTSPEGTSTRYTYDNAGRRIREQIDPAGLNLTRSYTYDRNNNLTSSVDANGNTSYYLYDAEGRQIFAVDGVGGVKETRYDAIGRISRLAEYRNALAGIDLQAYVNNGAMVGPSTWESELRSRLIPTASDRIEYRSYDANNHLRAMVNGLGEVTTYLRDGNGKVLEQRSYVNRITIGGAGSWTTSTIPTPPPNDAQDLRVRMAYDALGRLIASVDGSGSATKLRYDAEGNVIERVRYANPLNPATDPRDSAFLSAIAAQDGVAGNAVEKSTYDRANRLTWVSDAAGSVTYYSYDRDGNIIKKASLASAITSSQLPQNVAQAAGDLATDYVYDAAGRQIYTVGADGSVVRQIYDRNGNLTQRTEYATLIKQPVLVRGAVTGSTFTNYDRSNIGSSLRTAANDRTTSLVYDRANRQVLEVDALGAVKQISYGEVFTTGPAPADSPGPLPRPRLHSVTVTAYAGTINISGLAPADISFDRVMSLLVSSGQDRSTTQMLDSADRIVRTVDANGFVTAREYDGVGQLTHVIESALSGGTPSAQDRHTRYSYDGAGRLTGTTDALNGRESYSYNALGQKTSFSNKAGATWSYEYNAAGRMLRETSPPVDLVALKSSGSAQTALTPDPSNTGSFSVVTLLGYDAFGNLTSRTEAAGRPEERITRYEYDKAGRQVKTLFPPVSVYQTEANTALLANGRNGGASRAETVQQVSSETRYDALGNAVASRAMGSTSWSYKAYDRAGRVSFDVDAAAYVTGYTRNAWGETERLVRYAQAIGVPAGNSVVLLDATVRQNVAAPNAANREILISYDRAGRTLSVQESLVINYDSQSGEISSGRKTTTHSYTAFGDLASTSVNLGNSRTATTSYSYDKLGRRTSSADALGYLTTMAYDSAGNLVRLVEFAKAWATPFTTPYTNAGDRVTEYSYDQLNRKTAEIRRSVAHTGVNAGAAEQRDVLTEKTDDLTTQFSYDALGNLTRSIDALGGVTYSFYDVLGRLRASITPPLNLGITANGQGATPLNPLTEFQRDAHGNALTTTQYANGATVANDGQSYIKTASGEDRVTYTKLDALGHTTQITDAAGISHYYSYNAQGRLAKEWQNVTNTDRNGAQTQGTIWRAYAYDVLGRQTHTLAPSESGGLGVFTVSDTEIAYNAFGEMTSKSVKDGSQALAGVETYEYDSAGRVWRSNAGDGVYKILAYDLQGRLTAQLVSSGSIDLKTSTYPDTNTALKAQAANPTQFRRTDMRYDALGRLVQTLAPERASEKPMTISTRQNFFYGVISQSEVNDQGRTTQPLNQVDLVWRSLEDLGSGDVRITLTYDSSPYFLPEGGESGGEVLTIAARNLQKTVIVSAEEAAEGYSLKWLSGSQENYRGISTIKGIKVEKQDVFGNWASLYDTSTQPQARSFNWTEAASPAYIWNEAGDGRIPIYRYYNRYTDTHFFSTSLTERERLLNAASGWLDEGITGYVSKDPQTGLVPLYRMTKVSDPDISTYTTNAASLGSAWKNQGVEGYVGNPSLTAQQAEQQGLTKLYRLQNNDSTRGNGIFTTAISDRNALLGLQPVAIGQNNPRGMQVFNGSPGLSIEVSYPQDLVSQTKLEYRRYGSNDGWSTAPESIQNAFGSAHRFDLSRLGLSPGGYEYRITNTNVEKTRDVGSGTFTIYGGNVLDVDTQPLLVGVNQGSAIIDGSAYRVLQWPKPATGWTVEFRYRPQGSNGAWTSRTASNGQLFAYGDSRTRNMSIGMQGVAINFGVGNFEYEVVSTNTASGERTRATGTLATPADVAMRNTSPAPVTQNNNVTNQGIVGYVWSSPAPGRTPLYRFYFPYQGNDHHLTTADPKVIAEMQAMMPSGAVTFDGVIGYVETSATANNRRLYQYKYGASNVFRLTANPQDIGSFTTLSARPADNFKWSPTTWYQSAYQFDGYISNVPVEGTIPLYAVYDGNSFGDQPLGDYLTSTIENEIVSPWMLSARMAATANVPGVSTGQANIDGQTYNMLHWTTPESGARVRVSSYPSLPGGSPTLWRQGDGRAQFKGSAALQGIVLDVLNPNTTYTITIEVEYPATSQRKAYIARSEVTITVPTSGAGAAAVQRDTTPAYMPQIRITAGAPTNLNNRAITNREYDRWGNLTMVDDPRAQVGNPLYKTTFSYNANNQVLSQTQLSSFDGSADYATTRIYYDALGRQVGVRDGNGNLNAQVRDLAGNVVQERRADGGRVDLSYNAFGDKTSSAELMTSSRTVVTNYSYDKLSRLTQTELARAISRFEVQSLNSQVSNSATQDNLHAANGVGISGPINQTVLETIQYDEAGRKVRVVNGNNEATRYRYDLSGNVVLSGQETIKVVDKNGPQGVLGNVIQYRYDALGRTIGLTDANGMTQAWTYSLFGRLTGRTDSQLGNSTLVKYQYVYSNAGQLTRESNDKGKNLDYRYDGAGQLIEIRDNYLGQVSSYTYDLAGNRITEKLTQKTLLSSGVIENVVYQDSHLFYDAQNRLRAAFDGRSDVRIDYDKAGNRTQVKTHVINNLYEVKNSYQAPGQYRQVVNDSVTVYGYDAMNRQVSSREYQGRNASGTLLSSHDYLYDKAGNRIQDNVFERDASTGGTKLNGTYQYTYDDLHRLDSYSGYGIAERTDRILYDGAGRQIYAMSLTRSNNLWNDEHRYNQYDSLGRLQDTRIVMRRTDNREKTQYTDIAYHASSLSNTDKPLGYDAAGNLLGYVQVTDGRTSEAVSTTYQYQFLGGYQQTASTSKRGSTEATTYTWRDANGFISNVEQRGGVSDTRYNRAFVNDAQGNALYVNQSAGQPDSKGGRIQNLPGGYIGGFIGDAINPGHIQRQLVVNGEVIARYGDAPDSENPAKPGEVPKYVNTAEFHLDAAPLKLRNASFSPTSYTVVGGETLKTIARNVLGDSSLWWRIADANGLAISGDGELAAGQTLSIPKLALNSNNANTFQPYDPSRVVGSTDSVLPAPAGQGGGCGGLGKIIMVAVAVVVAVYAPQFLTNLGVTGLMTGAGATATTTALGAAVGGAAGSVASQAAGNLMGIQDGFDWKGVGLAALSGGLANGISVPNLGTGWQTTALRMATANGLTQGVGVVTGLQSSFDWKGVAASAAGGALGSYVGDQLKNSNLFSDWNATAANIARGTLSGFAAGTAAAVARGGRISVQQVATDAFGNALGGSLAAAMSSPGAQENSLYSLSGGKSGQGLQAPAGWGSPGLSSNSAGYDQLVGAFSNPGAVDRSNDVLLAAGPGYTGGAGSGMSDHDANIARMLRQANEPEAMGSVVPPYRVEVRGVGSAGLENNDRWYPAGPLPQDGGTVVGSLDDWQTNNAGNGLRLPGGQSPGVVGYFGGAAEILFGGAYNQLVKIGGGLASLPYLLDGVDAAVAVQDSAREKLGYHISSYGAMTIAGKLAPVGQFLQNNVTTPVRNYSERYLGDGPTTILGAGLQIGFESYGAVTGLRAAQGFGTAVLENAFAGPRASSRMAQLGGINLNSPRYKPGVASFGDDLIIASGRWLDATTPTPIPLQVATALGGKEFKTFGDLQSAVWKSIANDSDLSAGFNQASLGNMLSGNAPFVPRPFRNGQFGERFNLHHIDPIGTGGAVYNLSNIRIVTPVMHSNIHYPKVFK